MLGNGHVRFGGRAGETDREQSRHRAPARPNTYLRCWEGKAYFSFVIDVFSRKIVGWQLASHMRTDLVLDALRMALGTRRPGADFTLVTHTDQGSQPGLNRSSQQCVVTGMVGGSVTRLSLRRRARRASRSGDSRARVADRGVMPCWRRGTRRAPRRGSATRVSCVAGR